MVGNLTIAELTVEEFRDLVQNSVVGAFVACIFVIVLTVCLYFLGKAIIQVEKEQRKNEIKKSNNDVLKELIIYLNNRSCNDKEQVLKVINEFIDKEV